MLSGRVLPIVFSLVQRVAPKNLSTARLLVYFRRHFSVLILKLKAKKPLAT